MTRRRLWVVGLALAVALVGGLCWGLLMYRHVDRAADFAFDGTVKTAAGSPVADADIVFIDTGFDGSAASRHIERIVGRTGPDGRLAARLSYRYGFSYVLVRPSPKQTFRLVVRKSGMADVSREYQASDLPVEEGAFVLRFEMVVPNGTT